MKKSVFFILSVFLFATAQAQVKPLFTIDNMSVDADEFKRQFLKNLDLNTTKVSAADLDEYLDLYIKFKLKLKDGYDQGVDTTAAYREEMAMYRQQLAANYLIDKEVTEGLVKEAYDRLNYNVKAAHILVIFPPNYTSEDTLKAFQKITTIRKDIEAGKYTFEKAAKDFSDDKGTAENGGNLGYFTALQLVYPFETAAFNSKIGEITNVFRTTFGYHIIKVLDKKKNEGELEIGNILIRAGDGGKLSPAEAEKKVNDIYKSIVSNETTFEEMARKHSEDFNTKYRGGSMGELNQSSSVGDLEKQGLISRAFELKNEGDITKPFLTDKGWMILRRGVVRPLGTFASQRTFIKNRIQGDERSKKSIESLIEQVKKEEYKEKSGEKIMSYFTKEVSKNSDFFDGKWSRDNMAKTINGKLIGTTGTINLEQESMFTLGNETSTFGDFLSTLDQYYPKGNKLDGPATTWLNNLYTSFKKEKVLSYQNDHLEEKNEDFRNIYQEYREGILMFNRQQSMVWDKSNTDSAGLAVFYETRKSNYMWEDRFELQVYNTNNKSNMKKIYCQVEDGIKPDSILRFHNKNNSLSTDYRAGKFELGDAYLLVDSTVLKQIFADSKYKSKNGKVYKLNQVNNDWVVVNIINYLPAAPKELAETRGAVAAEYQNYLEKEWINSLYSKYKVSINQDVFKAIKKELVNE